MIDYTGRAASSDAGNADEVLAKLNKELWQHDENGQMPKRFWLTRDEVHALVKAGQTVDPNLMSIANHLQEFKNEFEIIRQEIEQVSAVQLDASNGKDYMLDEFIDFRSALGKQATEHGLEFMQVLSFGKIGVHQQHLTYRIYEAETDDKAGKLLVHSLDSLEEAAVDLEEYCEDKRRR
jgi:hypothetical protein